MPRNPNLFKTSFSRVFTIDGGASPANAPVYQGLARAGAISWSQGDVTPVRVPDPNQYDGFLQVDTIKGQKGLPSIPIDFRMTLDASVLLGLLAKDCDVDIQIHMGKCKNPSDFNGGWSDGKVIVLERARGTDYSSEDLGAMDSDQRAVVMETSPFTGLDLYEILPILPQLQADATITDEVLDVTICDAITCGQCGAPSDGCSVVLALISDSSGSPGIGASVVYTKDGGATWTKSPISSLPIGTAPNRIACVGSYVVVVSATDVAHHVVSLADLLAGLGGWTRVATGYVAAKGPTAITSFSSTQTWVVGNGGYIYRMTDPNAGVTVLDAGSVTSQNLSQVSHNDEQIVLAVGALNALVISYNAGLTWTAVTGPAVGIALTALAVKSETAWIIGSAGGVLYYTRDAGATWTTKAFSGSGAGNIADIEFANNSVGYMAHATAANVGRLFRTIDGGYSWYLLPEATGFSLPSNRKINAVAPCEAKHGNIVYAGGLANDANDGVLLKIA